MKICCGSNLKRKFLLHKRNTHVSIQIFGAIDSDGQGSNPLLLSGAPTVKVPECTYGLSDTILLIDDSGSIGTPHYNKMKDYIGGFQPDLMPVGNLKMFSGSVVKNIFEAHQSQSYDLENQIYHKTINGLHSHLRMNTNQQFHL